MLDERYFVHRLKATSWAGICGAVAMGIWVLVQFWTKNIVRYDLFVILGIMAAVKVGLMIYFTKMN